MNVGCLIVYTYTCTCSLGRLKGGRQPSRGEGGGSPSWPYVEKSLVVVLCVCLSVYYHASYYIPRIYVEHKVSLGYTSMMIYVSCGFFAVFKVLARFADHICLLCLFFELSMYKRDSEGFFSSRVVYRISYSSYNSTELSLVAVHYQLSFLGFLCCKH